MEWARPALAVDRLIRACTPAPGAWTTSNGAGLKLWPVSRAEPGPHQLRPGEIVADGQRVLAGTGTTPVELSDVQPEGKRRMPAADWIRGTVNTGGAPVLA